uniref:Uncharacterized protein n=1 Tax=Panagrolaimus superbus TaxID=310955 RepID=A0A914ZCX2_9BILA
MNSNQHVRTEVHEETTHSSSAGAGAGMRSTVPVVGAPMGAPIVGAPIVEHKEEKHGIMHDIKEGVKDAVGAITGKSSHEPSAKDHVKEAKNLHKKAEDALDNTSKDFKKAEKAQEKADKEAEKANEKTAKALNKQAQGQQYLAEAGAEMVEAGAKMQREAASDIHQAPYNVHQKGNIQQATMVDTGAQHVAAAAHDPRAVRDVRFGPPQ